MLKILSVDQVRALDAYTIQNNPIASIDLMEKACLAFSQWFSERFHSSQRIHIVCGTGNNGGDGLGIARILSHWGYPVAVWIVNEGKISPDFKINRDRILPEIQIDEFEESRTKDFSGCDVLIDALFGSGLTRPVAGIFEKAIRAMNATDVTRIAVDIPSGLFSDQHSTSAVVSADYTITFQLPKLAFMMPENEGHVGKWHVVDIGLSKEFIDQATTSLFYSDKKSSKDIIKRRPIFSHKGDYGKALLVAGSYGKMGACILSAKAALRAGVGLLTVHVPKKGYEIVQSTVPEAMVSIDLSEEISSEVVDMGAFDVIGVGPGIGVADETVGALKKILLTGKPLVIDADALNILSAHRELLQLIPKDSILTPHPKEFERLVGKWKNDFDRLEKLKRLSTDLKCVVVLKGAYTSVASPDGEVHFNSTGNPGMATGGTGDVLTGILTGLRAQKYSARETAILGVYLHGLAGDLAVRETGMNSLIASDVIDFLPAAFKSVGV